MLTKDDEQEDEGEEYVNEWSDEGEKETKEDEGEKVIIEDNGATVAEADDFEEYIEGRTEAKQKE